MCLIVFAWKSSPEYRLVLAANRDELHARPSRELQWWPDRPEILAGRDLQAGGTWLAVSREGRFATVTNYREHQRPVTGLLSRGSLTTEFVGGRMTAESFVRSFDGGRYAGVSVLVADEGELWYASNRGDPPALLEAGVYGLSNASLDTPWPKLVRSRSALQAMIDEGTVNESALLRMLADRTPAPADDVDAGSLPFATARAMTAPFIVSAEYGTRCSTVLLWTPDGQVSITEQRFGAGGSRTGQSRFRFQTGAVREPA